MKYVLMIVLLSDWQALTAQKKERLYTALDAMITLPGDHRDVLTKYKVGGATVGIMCAHKSVVQASAAHRTAFTKAVLAELPSILFVSTDNASQWLQDHGYTPKDNLP